MTKKYYVIVDLYSLAYMKNGDQALIDDADKFNTIEEAQKELKNYDDDFNGAIYEIIEHRTYNIKKVVDEDVED